MEQGIVKCCLVLLVSLTVILPAWQASANEFDDFQSARNAYDQADYVAAATQFDELVGGEVPRLQNHSLILESLKYLGASYLFLGQTEQSAEQFRRLVQLDPAYVLDPLAFPDEVQRVFLGVKAELEVEAAAQREAELSARDQERQRERALRAAEVERMQVLLDLARTERVELRASRWVAMLPFGAGQFQNGHDGLGLLLAVSEGALVAASITTYLLHEDLRGQVPATAADLADARFAEQAYRYSNLVSVAVLSIVALTGILDAQIRFVGSRVTEHKRTLPADLERPMELSFTGTGIRLRM